MEYSKFCKVINATLKSQVAATPSTFSKFLPMTAQTVQSMRSLERILQKEHLLQRFGLNRLGVFGSFARGEEAHDIDFFVDDETYPLDKGLKLQKILETMLGKPVDVVLKKYANPIVLYRAQKEMLYVQG
jgi:predicted nucleotidyltransferase